LSEGRAGDIALSESRDMMNKGRSRSKSIATEANYCSNFKLALSKPRANDLVEKTDNELVPV